MGDSDGKALTFGASTCELIQALSVIQSRINQAQTWMALNAAGYSDT